MKRQSDKKYQPNRELINSGYTTDFSHVVSSLFQWEKHASTGLKITAGQGCLLTGHLFASPVILTSHICMPSDRILKMTGQKQSLTELKSSWPVILTGDQPAVIFSPDLTGKTLIYIQTPITNKKIAPATVFQFSRTLGWRSHLKQKRNMVYIFIYWKVIIGCGEKHENRYQLELMQGLDCQGIVTLEFFCCHQSEAWWSKVEIIGLINYYKP